MRMIIGLSALMVLGACASTGTRGDNSYAAQLERLTAECRERGGILSPTGSQSGRPQTDNVCRITGGGSRLTTDRSN